MKDYLFVYKNIEDIMYRHRILQGVSRFVINRLRNDSTPKNVSKGKEKPPFFQKIEF